MAWDNTSLIVVTSGVASQIQNLSRQVLEHCGHVDVRTSTDGLNIVTLTQQSVHTARGELKSSPSRTCLSVGSILAAGFASFPLILQLV